MRRILQQNRVYGHILQCLPCELEKIHKELPYLRITEIDQYLKELMAKNVVASTGNEWEWDRRLLQVAYGRLTNWEKQGGMGVRNIQAALKWMFSW